MPTRLEKLYPAMEEIKKRREDLQFYDINEIARILLQERITQVLKTEKKSESTTHNSPVTASRERAISNFGILTKGYEEVSKIYTNLLNKPLNLSTS